MYPTAIMAVSLAASAAFAGWTVQGWRMETRLAEVRTEYANAQVRAVEKANAETIRLQAQADAAAKQHAARSAKMAHDAARARSERDGLRDELAASRVQLPDASCASVREYSATLSTVLGRCTDRLERMAEAASGHAIDSLNLQEAWPK